MAKRPVPIEQPRKEEFALAARILEWASDLKHEDEATRPALKQVAAWMKQEYTK